jgi:hypothetical protein
MSLFNVEILDQPPVIVDIDSTSSPSFMVDIETTIIDNLPNVLIELSRESAIILISDLPDNIPFTKIKKDGLDGVDYYLDTYEFDCGTP